MGITSAQAITSAPIGDARTSKNYLFISTTPKTNNQQNQQHDFFTNANLLGINRTTNNRFMSTMIPFIA